MEERIEFSVRRIQFSLWQLEFHSIIGIMEKNCIIATLWRRCSFLGGGGGCGPKWQAVSKKCKLRFEVCIFLAATTFLSELPPSLDFKT